jgi:hypothetical protein
MMAKRKRQRESATVAATRKLVREIEALEKTEQRAIDTLERTADTEISKPLALGQALVDLTRNNEELGIKTEQLRSLARTVNDESLRAVCSLLLGRRDKEASTSRVPGLKRKIEIRVTDALVSRRRARRGAADDSDESPASSRGEIAEPGSNIYSPNRIEHHDVLLIAPTEVHSTEEFYRFPVVKDPQSDAPDGPEREGQYLDKPELLDAFDYGQRRALSVARPQDWGPKSVRATQRGPAFCTLPLKPEPNAAAGGTGESSQCYLINTQNLNFRNAWTAEEWNDTPGGVDLPPAPTANQNEIEALLAGPQGKVFRLVLRHIADWEPGTQASIIAATRDGQRELGSIESVNLRQHMEVWHQLRGGTAMGRVYINDASGPRVVPLVNITTLTRE